MEEDVKPKDEDGVDGQGVCGWDGLLGGLGAVGASLTFGVVRGAGAFAAVLPTFVSVSRMHLAQHNRGFGHFFSAASSSRREAMVGGALAKGFAFSCRLGCQWGYHRVWIVRSSITFVDALFVDIFIFRCF